MVREAHPRKWEESVLLVVEGLQKDGEMDDGIAIAVMHIARQFGKTVKLWHQEIE